MSFPVFACLAFVIALTWPALADDVEIGKRAAKDWCSECHLVTPDQKTSVPDTGPTFMNLAQDPRGAEYFATFLQAPHHKNMEGLHISRYDIEDIVAYIMSLKKK